MNLFITLLENVNKSRTSANNVSLSKDRDENNVTAFEKSHQHGTNKEED
jgi:hypothetical protein